MPQAKPKKPYAAYPLYAHARGSWAARIGGKVRYFGPWRDPKAALDKYLAYMNGSTVVERKTVGSLTDAFLADKAAQLATGDITPVTFKEYKRTCEVIESHYGRGRPTDSLEFNSLRVALAKGKKKPTLGPVTLKRRLVIARMIFPGAGKPLKAAYHSAFEYSDCWVDDARLVVLNARDAANRGAEIATRTRVVAARREGEVKRGDRLQVAGIDLRDARDLDDRAGEGGHRRPALRKGQARPAREGPGGRLHRPEARGGAHRAWSTSRAP